MAKTSVSTELDRDKYRFPFSGYDIFGYLVPGSTFLLSIYAFDFWVMKNTEQKVPLHLPAFRFFNYIWEAMFSSSPNWFSSFIFFIILIVVSYISGHIIASVSALSIDRFLVFKGHGYPYVYLLNLQKEKELNKTKGIYSRSVFFWINLFFIISYFLLLQILPPQPTYPYCMFAILIFLLLILTTTKFIDMMPKEKKEALFKLRIVKFLYRLYNLSVIPYDFLYEYLSKLIDIRVSLNEDLIKKYEDYFKKIFGFNPDEVGTDNYWFAAMHVAVTSSVLNNHILNWLQLYGFSRNLASSFYLSFVYGYFSSIFQLRNVHTDFTVFLLPLIYFLLSFIMLFRYYYLYFAYYSKFIFRSFVFINLLREYRLSQKIDTKK